MARLTVERCKYDHFELVAIAAERAKQLISGAMPTIPKGKDKFPVVALREIEAGHIDREKMKETIINKYQTRGNHDNIDDEEGQRSPAELDSDDGYGTDDHDFASDFQGISEEEFDSDNIFSDDISENEDKI